MVISVVHGGAVGSVFVWGGGFMRWKLAAWGVFMMQGVDFRRCYEWAWRGWFSCEWLTVVEQDWASCLVVLGVVAFMVDDIQDYFTEQSFTAEQRWCNDLHSWICCDWLWRERD